MSVKRLSGIHRNAFITGASSGIGRAITEALLAEGIQVWGTSRSLERLAVFSGNTAFHPLVLDLGSSKQALAAFEQGQQESGGGFDLVVLCAGYGVFSPFEDLPADTWVAQLNEMLLTQLKLSHAAYSTMKRGQGGALVHVSSMATEFPLPFMCGYNMAKAATSALSESLIFEARGSAVRVIDFRPGDFRTDFNRAMIPGRDPAPGRCAAAWARLEQNLNESPAPAVAAHDLVAALVRRRRGIVRTGGFFQTRLAPFLARFAPAPLLRAAIASYFKSA